MLLLNFSHPLTASQLEQVETLSGKRITEVKNIAVHFDAAKPYSEQIIPLVDSIGFTPQQWQGEEILINPPSFNFVAVTLLAELHGRMGYFPPSMRLRPVKDSLPPKFEVAEVINLNEIREKARKRRNVENP
jgi:hypothetical protein